MEHRHALYALEFSEPYGVIPLDGSESAFLPSPEIPMSHLNGSPLKREEMQEMQEMPELVNDTEMLADYRVVSSFFALLLLNTRYGILVLSGE
jgi:hypothetical protein